MRSTITFKSDLVTITLTTDDGILSLSRHSRRGTSWLIASWRTVKWSTWKTRACT
ncbi:MAG: hypothetical protein R2744_12145 [Bacteroidales bacterium]